jgi:hypothetical protein
MKTTLQDPHARRLTDRVWNAFPVTQPAFAKLLGLLDIEVTHDVPTAAVTLGLDSRLLVNPDFAEAHCRTDAALVMLVLHELWHVALGHTRLYDRLTPAQNWAFDAVINAQLCRQFPDAAHTRLFRELYDADRLPWALLRPPEGWRTGDERWLPGRVGEVHRLLYSDSSASTEELFRLLPTLEVEGGELVDGLLGSHDGQDGETPAPEVLKEIREIIAEWPMVEQRSGRDLGGEAQKRRISLARRREDAVRILRRALARLAGLDAGDGQHRPAESEVESVLPYGRDRRAWLRDLWGESVPVHRTDLAGRTLTRRGRVQVYLDVSGSMDGVIRPLYAALAGLSPWISPEVQLFSTKVAGVSIARLRRGELVTTDGTDIAAVTGHMVRGQVERALIVTDGWVGNVPGEHAAALKRRRARVEAVVTDGGDPRFLEPLGGRCSRLPKLD